MSKIEGEISYKDRTSKFIDDGRERRSKLEFVRYLFKLLAAIFLGAGLFLLVIYLLNKNEGANGYAIWSAFLFILGIIFSIIPPGAKDLDEMKEEIGINELTLSNLDEYRDKADYLFRQHQRDLKRYYDQILLQNSKIFVVGIFCIVSGLVICVYVLSIIQAGDQKKFTDEDIVVAAFGAITSVSVNFIGALYLKMFSKIAESTGEFHRRLVGTHNIHFANLFASQLKKEDREIAIKKIIIGLIKSFIQNYEVLRSPSDVQTPSTNNTNVGSFEQQSTNRQGNYSNTKRTSNEGFSTDEITHR